MAKKTLLTTTLILGLTPFLTSCVTTKDHNSLQLKVRNQNSRIVNLEQEIDTIKLGGSDYTKTLQRQQAELATNMDHLRTTLLQLQGQVEEATHRNRSLLQENQQFQHELDAKMVSLSEQDAETKALLQTTTSQVTTITLNLEQEAQRRQEEALKKAELANQRALEAKAAQEKAQLALKNSQKSSAVIELTPRMEKGKSGATTQVTATTPAPTPVTTSPSPSTPTTTDRTIAEKLYDQGLGEYRSENYKGAIKSFSKFLEDNGNHKLLPNAKYWLGASRLKDGDYSGAVLEFQHIVADYPKHPKAPEALLKQAEAFAHFGDKMVQKKLYKDIISYYPKSEQAKTAKAKLANL